MSGEGTPVIPRAVRPQSLSEGGVLEPPRSVRVGRGGKHGGIHKQNLRLENHGRGVGAVGVVQVHVCGQVQPVPCVGVPQYIRFWVSIFEELPRTESGPFPVADGSG